MFKFLTPVMQDVTVFGDRAFKEVSEVKLDHMDGPDPI